MAGAIRGAPISKAGARVRLDREGVVTVETDMTDIGTGSYTIVQQTAAEMMGVPLEQGGGQARRFELSGNAGFRRSARSPIGDCGRLCRVHEVA